jgi:hypothetical protein
MDPVTAWSAGSRAFTGGTNAFYLVKDLLSVLVPGTVVLAELWYLLVVNGGITGSRSLMNTVVGFSTLQSILVSLFALAASYVVGFLSREVAFLALGLSRVSGSTAQMLDQLGALVQTKPAADAELGDDRDAGLMSSIQEAHPILTAGANEPRASRDARGTREGSLLFGGHAHSRGDAVDYAIFTYCKLWLRTQAPRLSVDHVEIEINILAASLVPTALVGVIMLAGPGDAGIPLRVAIGGVVILALLMSTRSAVKLRQRERFEALRNLCFDYMMRTSAQRLAGGANPDAPALPKAPKGTDRTPEVDDRSF